MAKPRKNPSTRRRELLKKHGIVLDEEIAALEDCTLKTFRNRPRSQKPEMFKFGRQQATTEEKLREFYDRRAAGAS